MGWWVATLYHLHCLDQICLRVRIESVALLPWRPFHLPKGPSAMHKATSKFQLRQARPRFLEPTMILHSHPDRYPRVSRRPLKVYGRVLTLWPLCRKRTLNLLGTPFVL
ncbi:hypothetical protein BJX76DRAFT_318211 [Aspergillus varians]